jgi:TPR repeat protein
MRRALLALAVSVVVIGGALAGPFEDGRAAYDRGDYETALRLFRPLADQGVAAAQTMLGVMYGDGRGVQQSHAEAGRWFRLAAAQGNADAQNNLGSMYELGSGVERDDAEAARWYRRAADQGDALGQYSLGTMYLEGRGVEQDYIQAYMWLSLVAARSPEYASFRDRLRSELTPAQIAEAQRLAREWDTAHPAPAR